MRVFHAPWIVPIEGPPIRDGWVAVDHGRVVALGNRDPGALDANTGDRGDSRVTEIDLGSVAVLPGLVNAHTHLELSWMRGSLPVGGPFSTWIRSVISKRREGPTGGEPELQAALADAVDECWRYGTALVGDIANTMVTAGPIAASRLHAVIFRELIGFPSGNATALMDQAMRDLASVPRTPQVRVTLAAHAPYSVSPPLFRAIRAALARDPSAPTSVHLGESLEEIEFLKNAGGPWRSLLNDLGAWDPDWVAPGCDPVEYLDRLEFLDEHLVCVHGVHLDGSALACLARRRATLVTCPRGNRLTGAGSPPAARFFSSGVRTAVGTDSLASVPDLNLFGELAELRRLAPEVPASWLLESATRNGAQALGWGAEFGTIQSGLRAALIAVTIPGGVADVEEYLVNGIDPEQIRWLE